MPPRRAGWGEQLVVQWPGLVCIGPSGLYRGTARAILSHAGAREEVVAAMHRSRGLVARPLRDTSGATAGTVAVRGG